MVVGKRSIVSVIAYLLGKSVQSLMLKAYKFLYKKAIKAYESFFDVSKFVSSNQR